MGSTDLDNLFMGRSDYKKGYFKLNFKILYSDDFLSLTKSEKIIVINLLKIKDLRKNKIKATINKIMEWTGRSLKSVNKFLDRLSNMLHIVRMQNMVLFDCMENVDRKSDSEQDVWLEHLIEYRARKAKCSCNNYIALKQTMQVMKQYRIKASKIVMELIDSSLNSFTELVPKFINKQAQLI